MHLFWMMTIGCVESGPASDKVDPVEDASGGGDTDSTAGEPELCTFSQEIYNSYDLTAPTSWVSSTYDEVTGDYHYERMVVDSYGLTADVNYDPNGCITSYSYVISYPVGGDLAWIMTAECDEAGRRTSEQGTLFGDPYVAEYTYTEVDGVLASSHEEFDFEGDTPDEVWDRTYTYDGENLTFEEVTKNGAPYTDDLMEYLDGEVVHEELTDYVNPDNSIVWDSTFDEAGQLLTQDSTRGDGSVSAYNATWFEDTEHQATEHYELASTMDAMNYDTTWTCTAGFPYSCDGTRLGVSMAGGVDEVINEGWTCE